MTDAPGGRDPLDADLAELVQAARAEEAVRSRGIERTLLHQAAAGASVAGLLLDLAEEGAEVSIRMTSGRAHQGAVRAVGRDFAVVGPPEAQNCLVLDAIAAIRRRPGRRSPDASGDRPPARHLSLAAYLGGLAADRPRVAIVAAGEPAMLVGELRAVGRDVATVRLEGQPPVTVYVALASVSEVFVSG